MTSLFIDVVGSTELTVRFGPERLKAALDRAFAELRAVIEGKGGTVEKFIGDAIYALFGAPVAHPDDPERALRAAAGARAWAATRAGTEIPLSVRVGLETGEAIVDVTAASESRQQMSVGAVVTTAARLQQRAEPGQVLVGPVAHDATAEIATFAALGQVELKGLGRIEVFELGDIREGGRQQGLPFVGREAELDLLRHAERRAKTRSVLALVAGPPGQGKTRLVGEFVASLEGVRVLEARCRPGGEIGALAPLRELLLGDRPAADLDAIVGEAISDPTDRSRVADSLAHSAGLRASAGLAAVGKDERADEIANAWRRFLRGLSERGPVAVWVEDVHWAAPEVVSLVDRLSLTGDPLLVIITARPEFAEEAGLRPSGDRFFIDLGGLEPEAARALVATARGEENEDVLRRAEGNPLFLVELARASDLSGELPLTLQGALGARLDELSADDRALLAHGAVIGETFAAADVALLGRRDAEGASRAFARLAERHYLAPVDGRYRFHHSLLRDVAYGRLLSADRLRLHARFAHERSGRDDPEVLAHHWWAALGNDEAQWVWTDDPALSTMRREAFAAHLAAGRRQATLFATDRAAIQLERAYSFADDDMTRGEAKAALGDAYANDLRGDESWRAYLDARDHYATAGAAVPPAVYLGALKVRLRFGGFHHPPSNEEVHALTREAQDAARRADDPGTMALTLLYSAYRDMDPSVQAGDPALVAEAVRLSERADLPTKREVLGWYANDLVGEGDLDRAVAVLDQIDAMPGEISDFDRMEHLRGRAAVALRRGSLDELASIAERLVAMSRRMGPHLRTHAELAASSVAFASGDWPAVIALAAATDRLIQASPATAFCSAASVTMAHGVAAHSLAGQHEEARALTRRLGAAVVGEWTAALHAFAMALGGTPFPPPPPGGTPTGMILYIAASAVIGRNHELALATASDLERRAGGGSRSYTALAEAIREEVAHDRGGPPPSHAGLRAIGFIGWSQLLSARAPA